MTFDLQAARAICDKLASGKDAIDIDYQNALAAEMFPAALDRIAELEAALVEERTNEIENNPNRSWVAESQNALRKWAMDRAHEQLHVEGKI